MSLFKFRDWWGSNCGTDEESFDRAIVVANIDNAADNYDKVIVGSHSGLLRVFSPSNSVAQSQENSLLLEAQLKSPILDLKVGRFVSSTANLHLAVLHPRQLSVYAISAQLGTTAHGTSYNVSLIYEHNLKYSSFNLTVGPFGKVQGRDFICVQSLDGTLLFFEQESFSFQCFLPGFLLPGPIAHLQYTDSLVVVNSNNLQCYKYQALAVSQAAPRAKDDGDKLKGVKGLDPVWMYNLGEAASDMTVLPVTNCPAFILVLGERHIFCLRETGMLRFMKRLDFQPSCFHPYSHGDVGNPFFMVASYSKVVLVFEETCLRWAAELPFVPVAVLRANFRGLQGGLVLLSASGQLQCGYLGTAPAILVTAPVESREINYSETEKEMTELKKVIKSSLKAGAILNRHTNPTVSLKILISETRASKLQTLDETREQSFNASSSAFTIKVECLSATPVCNVQVVLHCERSFAISQPAHVISYVDDSATFETEIKVREGFTVSCLVGRAIATYLGPSGTIISQSAFNIPLKLAVFPVFPQKEATHKITLAINKPVVSMETLFPELGSDVASGQAAGFQFHGGGPTVTVLAAKASQRYRLQSDVYEAIFLLLEQLIARLKNHFNSKADGTDLICTNLNKISTDNWMQTVQEHFQLRLKSMEYENQLMRATTQYRAIEKRLLNKFKDKNPSPLSNLDQLLESTYEVIIQVAEEGFLNKLRIERAASKMTAANRLLYLLVKLQDGANSKFAAVLKNVLCPTLENETEQGLEEMINLNLVHLLKTFKTLYKDKLPLQAELIVPVDTNDLQKHMEMVLDQFCQPAVNTINEK